MAINSNELVEAFSDSLGEGQAEEVLETAAQRAGVAGKRTYTSDEALEIADVITELDDVSSFVRVSANTVKTRIRSGDIGS